jgi:hypothetical protein
MASASGGFVQDRLHHSVFARVVRNDGEQSTHGQCVECGVESVAQFIFFAIHYDAKRLEDSGRDVTATTSRHGDRAFDRFAQFVGRLGLAFEDGLGDGSSESTLPIFAKEPHQLVLVDVAEELGRGFAPGRVHAHVERRVRAKREATAGVVELV